MRAIASPGFPLLRDGRGVLAAACLLGSLARAGTPTGADLAGGVQADLGAAVAQEPAARTAGLFLKFSRSF